MGRLAYTHKQVKTGMKCLPSGEVEARRTSLLETHKVPAQTEVRTQMGPHLSEVFFADVCPEAKTWLGLTPPLVGPGDPWISPDTRLNNKPCLSLVPEPHSLHLKAFNHRTILEVGQNHIELLQNRHRLDKEQSLRLQKTELEKQCAQKIDTSVEKMRLKEDEHCKNVVGTLMEHFDACFRDLVKETSSRLKSECEVRVREEQEKIAGAMLQQLQEAVLQKQQQLCREFREAIKEERQILAGRYSKKTEIDQKDAQKVLENTIHLYEGKLSSLQMQMEASAVVDVCQATTKERLRCCHLLAEAQEQFKSKIADLNQIVEDLRASNSTLVEISEGRCKKIQNCVDRIQTVVNEFQTFVGFALKAMPGQSEYLLSLEKLSLQNCEEDIHPTLNILTKQTSHNTDNEHNASNMTSFINGSTPELLFSESPGLGKVSKTEILEPKINQKTYKTAEVMKTPATNNPTKYSFEYSRFWDSVLKRSEGVGGRDARSLLPRDVQIPLSCKHDENNNEKKPKEPTDKTDSKNKV